ncbi:MAG TPA: hypothetical protein VNI01_08890 [Elusimicrobiota bacterium]|jgi:hypothetical protein|nr:hypothetical protein [Elusimicrobiota bacterium]
MKQALILLAALSLLAAAPKKASYEARARQELASIGAKIDRLEVRAREKGVEARQRIAADLDRLRGKKGEADGLVEKLKGASEEAGRKTQAALDRAIDDLKRAYRDAERKLGAKKS